MTDEGYDELSTKREMVRLLAKDATGEQLDAAIDACLDKRLNDAERRGVFIRTVYGSWYERLAKKPRPSGVWLPHGTMSSECFVIYTRSLAPHDRLHRQRHLDEQSARHNMAAPMPRLPGVATHGEESAMLEHIRRAL